MTSREERPQFYPNTLQPVDLNKESLQSTLASLQHAMKRGIDILKEHILSSKDVDDAAGSIYSGDLGIALAFLRLSRQVEHITRSTDTVVETSYKLRQLASHIIPRTSTPLSLQPGRISPLHSASLSASVTRIIFALNTAQESCATTDVNIECASTTITDVANLREAITIAMEQPLVIPFRGTMTMGGDEVLLGRTGLLWALLSIRTFAEESTDTSMQKLLNPICDAVPTLVRVIVEAGIQGAQRYEEMNREAAPMPLMWPWVDKYYSLGGMHGISGILTVLLSCRGSDFPLDSSSGPEEKIPTYTLIARTISYLCNLTLNTTPRGHLPFSIPAYPSTNSNLKTPFVQLCHGAPGLVTLLSAARSNAAFISQEYWQPEWSPAAKAACDRIWEEGLLGKGLGVCHGVAGNAWSLLILSHAADRVRGDVSGGLDDDALEALEGDMESMLSHALAFLLQTLEMPPFTPAENSGDIGKRYRVPDNAYSLFEGLAGTMCAWGDACVVLSDPLRYLGKTGRKGSDVLGIPCLGGLL